MNKRFLTIVATVMIATSTSAGTIDSAWTYHGTIQGVAIDFWNGIGVGLTGGATCLGQSVVILPYSNPKHKEILALLLAAEASGKTVRIYRMSDYPPQSFYNGTYQYCTLGPVSLGDFPVW